jgi:hypothetical protein
VLREIMVTQCADRGLHALVAGHAIRTSGVFAKNIPSVVCCRFH